MHESEFSPEVVAIEPWLSVSDTMASHATVIRE